MTNEERAILDLMDDAGQEWISLDENGYVLGVDRDVLADRIRSLCAAAEARGAAAERAACKALAMEYGDISVADAIERRRLDDEIAAARQRYDALRAGRAGE